MTVVLNVISKYDGRAISAAERDLGKFTKMAAAQPGVAGSFIRSGAALSNFGKSAMAAGKSMTMYLTLPLAVAAGVAIKFAMDFNKQMTLVQTQAGGTAKDVAVLSAGILGMKNALQGPVELAKAMYHLKSVGMGNADAMTALGVASKAAAMGNADLEQTATALAGVWKTGIKGAETFGSTMGYVNAIVGAGNMRLSDFVGALSSGVMATAKVFGVSLQSVGAGLARMTDMGIHANVAANMLNMTFLKLGGKPTAAASKVLDSIHLSGASLALALRKPDGLVTALQLLQDHLKGLSRVQQAQDLSTMFGGSRGSKGIMVLLSNLGALQKKYVQIGQTQKDFWGKVGAYMNTPAAKWKEFTSALQRMATVFGTDLLPDFTRLLGFLTSLGQGFTSLSPGIRHVIEYVAGFAAVVGPATFAVGAFARSVGTLMQVIGIGAAAKSLGWMNALKGLAGGGGLADAAKKAATSGGGGYVFKGGATTAAADAAGAASGTAWGTAFAAAGGMALAAALPLVIAGVAGKLGGARGYGIKAPAAPANAPLLSPRGAGSDATRNAYLQSLNPAATAAATYKPIVQTLTLKMQTAGYDQERRMYAAVQALQALAAKGISLNVKNLGKAPVQALIDMRNQMMSSLHLTASQAEAILNTIAGHKLHFTWSKQTGAELAKTKSTVTSQGGAIVKSLQNSGNKAGAGFAAGVNHGQGPTRAAAAALGNAALPHPPSTFGIGASIGAGLAAGMSSQLGNIIAVANSLASAAVVNLHKGISNPPYPSLEGQIVGRSLGMGVAYGMRATQREIADSAGLLALAAVNNMTPPGAASSLASSTSRARPGEAGEVHYHSHTHYPPGLLIGEEARVAERLRPYQERATRIAEARHRRGRVGR